MKAAAFKTISSHGGSSHDCSSQVIIAMVGHGSSCYHLDWAGGGRYTGAVEGGWRSAFQFFSS